MCHCPSIESKSTRRCDPPGVEVFAFALNIDVAMLRDVSFVLLCPKKRKHQAAPRKEMVDRFLWTCCILIVMRPPYGDLLGNFVCSWSLIADLLQRNRCNWFGQAGFCTLQQHNKWA